MLIRYMGHIQKMGPLIMIMIVTPTLWCCNRKYLACSGTHLTKLSEYVKLNRDKLNMVLPYQERWRDWAR